MTQNGQITDTELLDVFCQEDPAAGGMAPGAVQDALRDLIETLWVDPDPETPPADQLHQELEELTEFLESEDTLRLVGALQEVLGAYTAGTLAWTEPVSESMKEGAEAIAEELNPDPPRQKLESTIYGAAGEDPVVLFIAEDTDRRPELEEAIARNANGTPVFLESASPEQAQEQFLEGQPHLVLMGVTEGEGQGDSDFLPTLREANPWTPVLVFSRYTDARSRRRMVASGANRVLSPTCSEAQLYRALDGLLP